MKGVKITIELDNERTLIYTAPQSAELDVWTVETFNVETFSNESNRIKELHVTLLYDNIKEERIDG